MGMRGTGRSGAMALILLLAGCAAEPQKHVAAPASAPARAPIFSAGLEGVMGRTAGTLAKLFGKTDLDVREGTARKLQFSSPVCVLDAYLYPPEGGGEPIVTYVDARLPDGRDMDKASCVAALEAAHR